MGGDVGGRVDSVPKALDPALGVETPEVRTRTVREAAALTTARLTPPRAALVRASSWICFDQMEREWRAVAVDEAAGEFVRRLVEARIDLQ